MHRGQARTLFLVALLAFLCSSLETVFAATAHAEHAGWYHSHAHDDAPDSNDGDHCGHLLQHFVGQPTEMVRPPRGEGKESPGPLRVLLLGARAPPPTPPPNV